MNKVRQFSVGSTIILVLVGIIAWAVPGTRFSANVVDLLPGGTTEVRILRELADKGQGRQLSVVLSHRHEEITPESVERFRATLLDSGTVTEVWPADIRAFSEPGRLLFENRYPWLLPFWLDAHFPGWQERAPPDSTNVAEAVVDELDSMLQSPEGFALEESIPGDPFLLMNQVSGIDALAPARSTEGTVLLWVQQSASPFVETDQKQLFAALGSALEAARQGQPGLEMAYTGVAVFAHASKEGIKREIQRLNLMGLLLVLTITVLVLRNPLDVLRIVMVVAGSLSAAAAMVIVSFSTVHVIALVIGSILAGVTVDYAFHLVLVERGGLSKKAVARAVITGSVSSALGFIILVWAPLPFLRQVGVFVGTGLIAALLLSLLLRPASTERTLPAFWRLPPFGLPSWTGPVVAAFSLLILFTPGTRDSINDLEYPLPEVEALDREIRGEASLLQGRKLVLAHGKDILQARARLEAFTESTGEHALIHAGRWIPEPGKSRAAHAFFHGRDDFAQTLMARLEARGYIREAFAPFLESWQAYMNVPPGEAAYRESTAVFAESLPGPLRTFLHNGEDIAWFGVFVPESMEVSGPGLLELDRERMLSESFSSYRRQLILFAGICLAAILIGLVAVYRVRSGLISFFLPAIALAMALGISGILHQGIGVFQIVGGLLAFCICLDYAIFAVQSWREQTRMPASVTVSSITTVGVFAILATSRIPGVSQLALTVIFCIGSAILLVLAGWPLQGRGRSRSADILRRLPHGPEALMIHQILESDERRIQTEGTSMPSNDMPAEFLIEALAQSAAAWMVLQREKTGVTAAKRMGMVVLIRECRILEPVVPAGSRYRCTVVSQSEPGEGFLMFDGYAENDRGGAFLEATFSIFISPPDTITEPT